MKVVRTYLELSQELAKLERPLGLVPTMGFLHEGHISLVRRAKNENSSIVVSIFTNPTQFSPDEDLDNYPRDEERDLELLAGVGTDLVWIPSAEEMYPSGFQTWVEMEHLYSILEGNYRPTHFRGVATIVAKLFNAVCPDKAYFGQKDAQQAVVIQQMVRDLSYMLEIVICPIVREPDGLAMSSRNTYLNDKERKAARCLSRGLEMAREAFSTGERTASRLTGIVKDEVLNEPLAELQYVSCTDPMTLADLDGEITDCLISMAVYIGQTRLIDNIILLEQAD